MHVVIIRPIVSRSYDKLTIILRQIVRYFVNRTPASFVPYMNRPVGHQRMHTKRRAIAHASCVGSIVSIIYPRIICARLSNHWVENRAVFYFPSCIASVVMNFAVFMQHSTKPMRNANNSIRPNSFAGLCWMDFSIVNRSSWDVEKTH